VIPEREYLKCKAGALELARTTPLGELPIWNVVQAVFKERGAPLTPRLTWRLCTRLWSDVLKEYEKSEKDQVG